MVGRRPRIALVASVFLLAGSQSAFAADDDGSPFQQLVQVYVPDAAAVDRVVSQYDAAEYRSVQDDGSILLAVFVTADEKADLKAKCYKIGRVIEDSNTGPQRMKERQEIMDQEALAANVAENGLKAAGRSVQAIPDPGDTVIQRAVAFTDAVGPPATRTTARFLYVEAFNKSTKRVPGTNSSFTGPTLALSYAGPDGVYSTPVNMGRFIDNQGVTPQEYMYHRQLVRLTGAYANLAANDIQLRVATAATAGGAEASVETFPVTEWLGTDLPPHVAGFRTQFFTGTFTYEVSGLQGDLGDFTLTIQEVIYSAVVLTTNDWGHEGGNQVQAEFRNPGAADQPLSVTVTDKLIEVVLGTDSAGALNSTAKNVVDAINANPAAAALVKATTFRGNRGSGIVQPRARTNLSDFLNAPASVARGPLQQHLYRIGAHRDGSKVGVFLFCQQHAREWTTSLTCQETAHQLVENYATDPQTKQLLDNVEVFISPNSNPDGGHYSMYDASAQRRTMVNYCPENGTSDPAARNAWGVDMNRNSGEYSLFDGYFGASTSCTSDTYAGPSEYSEPETRNEKWVVDTFPNIKFMNNIHSFGGYFMWAPGSYKNDGFRTTAPAPNIGIENYFFEAGEKILRRIKDVRGTVILPERTGPIADVLYSAAGNSADDGWYRKGVIAYSFETGADRILNTTTGTQMTQVGFQPCFGAVGTGGGQGSCPASGSLVNEGRDEALEFAAGNFGMVESACVLREQPSRPFIAGSRAVAATPRPALPTVRMRQARRPPSARRPRGR
jgi:hypothetical protein